MHYRVYNEIQLHKRRIDLLERLAKQIDDLPEEFDPDANSSLKHLIAEEYADVSHTATYLTKLVDAIKMNRLTLTE